MRKAYIAPIARIKATRIFALAFICNFHTRKKGRIANIQSPIQVIAE